MSLRSSTPTNPYGDRLRELPAYGRCHPKVPLLLAAVTLDPQEAVISSVRCNHGQAYVGHLTITNRRLRWFQRLPVRSHDHWPLHTTMVLRRTVPPVIELATGDLFQARGISARPLKEFVGLHQQMVEAMQWEVERTADAPIPVSIVRADRNLSEQLDHLVAQAQLGVLTAAEFAAAKARLLGLTA